MDTSDLCSEHSGTRGMGFSPRTTVSRVDCPSLVFGFDLRLFARNEPDWMGKFVGLVLVSRDWAYRSPWDTLSSPRRPPMGVMGWLTACFRMAPCVGSRIRYGDVGL